MKSEYDPVSQLQHNKTIRQYMEGQEVVKQLETDITLHFSYPKEIERMLEEQGLEIVELYQDWERSPVSGDCRELVYVCKKVN